MSSIAIINQSTHVNDATMPTTIAALQRQITEHIKPWWGVDATLIYVPIGQSLSNTDPVPWKLILTDIVDDADALGYHLDSDNNPTAKVFPTQDTAADSSLSVTISHELIEMLGDPTVNRTIVQGPSTYIVELCDAVEADSDGYEIDGIRVSNFVTPAYFNLPNPFPTNPPIYDFCRLLVAPCPMLRPGGYLELYNGSQWTSITARLADGSQSLRSRRANSRRVARVLAHSFL